MLYSLAMKLSRDAIISPAKITDYLLIWKPKRDKSKWLNQAGYTLNSWRLLEQDIRDQLLLLDANFVESNPFGDLYRIDGELVTPVGSRLAVRSIWMIEFDSGLTKFVTMYPWKLGK